MMTKQIIANAISEQIERALDLATGTQGEIAEAQVHATVAVASAIVLLTQTIEQSDRSL